MHIVGILLAAGQGLRFGGDKLSARLADGTPVAAAAARSLNAALPGALAVIRPEQQQLAQLFRQEGLDVLRTPDAAAGMGASLAAAVRAHAHADAWVVALADMPWVRPDTVRAVVRALAGGAALAAPEFGGRRGHPVGFSARWCEELVALTGDQGARGLVARNLPLLSVIHCDDPGCVADVDLPSDLHRD